MGKAKEFIKRSRIMTLGLSFAIAVMIGLAIGFYLDKRLQTFPLMTIIWLIIGFAAGLKNLYTELKRA
jgi:ATP synthase protein I